MIVGTIIVQKEKMPTKDEMAKFAKSIEEFVIKTNYNYIEAIVEYCKETGLEIEVAATLINSNLKAKIENVALDNNMLKEKGARLPI
jgi:precorrin-4 methylase